MVDYKAQFLVMVITVGLAPCLNMPALAASSSPAPSSPRPELAAPPARRGSELALSTLIAAHAPWLAQAWGGRDAASLAAEDLDQQLASISQGRARFYNPAQQHYHALASKFLGPEAASTTHLGLWAERRGKRWFARTVVPGGPAAAAGIAVGDELVSLDGHPFMPNLMFATSPSRPASLRYRRLPWDQEQVATIRPERGTIEASLVRGMRQATRLIRRGNQQIGYLWMPILAGAESQAALSEILSVLSVQSDALILDLRGDFAGGDLVGAQHWLASAAQGATYQKPLRVLVDRGTSGGREALAALLQKTGRATLLGTVTAGAAAPGQALALRQPYGLAYLPKDPPTPPVRPETVLEPALVYAAGSDPVLAEALGQLAAR